MSDSATGIYFTTLFQVLTLLPYDKILDMTKLKAFADDKLIVAKMTSFLLDRVGNTGNRIKC